jgi:hypothetical protein
MADTALRIDLGCGIKKKEGFVGVDSKPFDGKVDIVHDLTQKWPFEDGTVTEAYCSHFLEHLTAQQRIHFVNELHRVLKPGAKNASGQAVEGFATIITPHWASNRAYGDLTHQWPPVAEMWFFYLSKDWRRDHAPHNDFYTCDFEASWSYKKHPALQPWSVEDQKYAMQFFKEAAQDLVCTLVKKPPHAG